jgi:glutamate-5-semialdehyde dehydrogenase
MKLSELQAVIKRTKVSCESLLKIDGRQRKAVLLGLAKEIYSERDVIIKANRKDIVVAKKSGKNISFIKRLSLDENKIKAISKSLEEIAIAEDSLFQVLEENKRPSGIKIKKVRFPLGLLAIIYESRPNVTIDAFALAFKSGNAVILKGGKEIKETNRVLVNTIKKVLEKNNINASVVQDVSGLNKELTLGLLRDKRIDCLIPRGGKSLIDFVKKNATVPIIETGASVVHAYVDKSADLEMAKNVILNAKIRRVSICNALDVLIIHHDIAQKFLKLLASVLTGNNIELKTDKEAFAILKKIGYSRLKKATSLDFDTEFLDYILAIKTVKSFEEALDHIKKHSLGHSEAIITKNKKQTEQFFREIDAACLYWNTSTQFSDGGEFGMGGEIGISTQKLHARGPFSYQALTTYKYLVESEGVMRA